MALQKKLTLDANLAVSNPSAPAISPKLAAAGSFQAIAKASLVDGETFTIDDGVNPAKVFEFDTNASVSGSNVAVDISAATTSATVATAMINAINGVGALLAVTASDGGSGLVSLVNDSATASAVALAETVSDSGFTATGLTVPTGATNYSYKIVGLNADGSHTAASSAGSSSAGPSTLNSNHLNRVTWTVPAGATSVDVYRTVGGVTQGKIANVLAPTATLDDNGLAGDAATAPSANNTGGGIAADVSMFEKFTVYMDGFTGTWKLQISDDGTNWYDVGSAVTNNGYVDCTSLALYARVDVTAYTSGTPAATLRGMYSHDGG